MSAAMTSTKNGYQKMLHVYLKRREELKVRCGGTGRMYKLQVRTIKKKIKAIKRAIRIISKQEKHLSEIDAALEEFMGISVFKIRAFNKKMSVLAKRIFQRQALEEGLPAKQIAVYCGLKMYKKIYVGRKEFIRSMTTNEKNREYWQRWKMFYPDFKEKFGELKKVI